MTRRHVYIALALVVVAAFFLAGGPEAVVQAVKGGKSRDPNKLLPQVRDALAELRRRLDAKGVPTFVGETLRTADYQATKVADGKSATQNSWHLLGRAVDLYPVIAGTNAPDLNGSDVERFRTMHDEASKLGFRGLAFNLDGTKRYLTTSSGKVWDAGHLEFPEGMTFAQAQAAGARGIA